MIVIAVASVLIVTLGGYIATLKADFVQGIIMFFGITALIIAVVRCDRVGGLSAGLSAITQKTAELNLGPKQYIALFSTLIMTSFGTLGLPQMIHKYYGIKDKHEVKRGTIISTLFALLVAGGGYFIGSLSHLFYTQPQVDSLGGVDYIVPNMLSEAGMPTILLGLVLVLLIAASVSTLSSITITASTTLTMDFIRPRAKKLSPSGAAWVTKILCVVFIALSYTIANTDTPILEMMSYSWGILSGAFLAPYALALYRKKMNLRSAWAGMLGGFLTALPPLIFKLLFPTVELGSLGKVADMGPQFAVAAMLVSLMLCIVVSACTKQRPDECDSDFYEDKTPQAETVSA